MNTDSSRRSARFPLAIALAFGAGLLAMAAFAGLQSEAAPARDEAPQVGASADAEAIAAEIAALRERNANALAELEEASSDLEATPEAPADTDEPASSSPKKPRPKKPRPKQPNTDEPPKNGHRPIEFSDGRDPLSDVR